MGLRFGKAYLELIGPLGQISDLALTLCCPPPPPSLYLIPYIITNCPCCHILVVQPSLDMGKLLKSNFCDHPWNINNFAPELIKLIYFLLK